MVSGTYWVWDGVGFRSRPIEMHHHDAYELLDGEVEQPDLDAMAECMATNPHVHAIVTPHFATWDRFDEAGTPLPSPRWSADWAGTYLPDHATVLVSLRWSGTPAWAVGMLAHELCHSVEKALFVALESDEAADMALAKWLRILCRHGVPEGYPWKWWEGTYNEPLALSYECWHANRDQPNGLALPKAVERIYRGIRSGKVWRRYMS